VQIPPSQCLCIANTKRYRALRRATLRRLDSEEKLVVKQRHELDVVQHAYFEAALEALDGTLDSRAQQLFAVALAVRETCLAKHSVMIHRKAEAAIRRQHWCDMDDMAADRIQFADRRMGALLHHMNTHGLRSSVRLPPASSPRRGRKRPRERSTFSSDTDEASTSEIESSGSSSSRSSSVSS
jgi:hypothetical protein